MVPPSACSCPRAALLQVAHSMSQKPLSPANMWPGQVCKTAPTPGSQSARRTLLCYQTPVPTEGHLHLHRTYHKHEACGSTQQHAACLRTTRGPRNGKGLSGEREGGKGGRTTPGLLDPQTRLHQTQRHSVGQVLMHRTTSVPTEGSWIKCILPTGTGKRTSKS